jgi:hypothetical protein
MRDSLLASGWALMPDGRAHGHAFFQIDKPKVFPVA